MEKITQKAAAEIIKQYELQKIEEEYKNLEPSLTDELPNSFRPYGLPEECRNGGCWFYIKSCPPGILASSSFIAASKTTGKIVFEGSPNDEG